LNNTEFMEIAKARVITAKNHDLRMISALNFIRKSIRITAMATAIIIEKNVDPGVVSEGGSIP